jgi:hypothetical protein
MHAKFLSGSLKRRVNVGDLYVDGRINKNLFQRNKVCIELVQDRINYRASMDTVMNLR